VLGWNAFGSTETYIQQSGISPALKIVSPDWFKLDANQFVISKVDPQYIDWAHNSGKQVWPLLGNRFDTELTNVILSDPAKRQQVVNFIRDTLIANDIDGINVDFENMDLKNKQDYVAFIRQLKQAVRPYGRIVSVDVSRENPDPNWSGCF